MDKKEFQIGDKIIHKSNSSVIWIIERIENNEAYCSTLLKDTREQKKEKFILTSICHYSPPQIRVGTSSRRGNYF
jgi:hypothetical protein